MGLKFARSFDRDIRATGVAEGNEFGDHGTSGIWYGMQMSALEHELGRDFIVEMQFSRQRQCCSDQRVGL